MSDNVSRATTRGSPRVRPVSPSSSKSSLDDPDLGTVGFGSSNRYDGLTNL